MIELAELKKWLHYSPLAGVFEWRRSGHAIRAGALAGSICKDTGYIEVRLRGKHYKAHHLAWFYMTGVWPESDIDHKDGDRTNNAFGNLRLATKSQNQWNKRLSKTSTSGVKGVSYDRPTRKWRATVGVDDKKVHVGLFKTKEEAEAAAREKRTELHGEFANHGLHGYEIEELEDASL